MSAPEVPEIPEVHPLGGMTRAEALKVYDTGRLQGASSEDMFKEVEEIGRRVSFELGLLDRAADEAPHVLQYVIDVHGFTLEPLDGDALAAALEEALDDLQRGYSDTCEGYDEFLKTRKKRKKRRKRDRVLLAEAADSRVEELQHEIDAGNMPRADVSRMKRELTEMHGVTFRAWGRIRQ